MKGENGITALLKAADRGLCDNANNPEENER